MNYQQIFNLVKQDMDIINNALSEKLNLNTTPVARELKQFLKAPAKRIRPLLAVLYLKAAKKNLTPNHYKLLTAIELVHNASLIHDDVTDSAELRRGRKTLNMIFNSKIAVVAGDYLLASALEYINEINNPRIIEKFANTLGSMCEGEFSQYLSRNKIPPFDDYLRKTEQKTAKLFMTALECSMLISSSETEDALNFAKNFGIAFQIKDDLTNILTTKSDIKSGIYTAPVILSGSVDNPAIEKTRSLLNNYICNALQCINCFESSTYKTALQSLAEIYAK